MQVESILRDPSIPAPWDGGSVCDENPIAADAPAELQESRQDAPRLGRAPTAIYHASLCAA